MTFVSCAYCLTESIYCINGIESVLSYSELCQLQSNLNKGIRARSALLNHAFSKVIKQIAMEVHVISDLLG